jgi:UbiD family decarboxylase
MSLREFIERLNERGKLQRIQAVVDWKYELGEITRASRNPLLFENIKDYPGHRVFTNGLVSTETVGLALGIPDIGSRQNLVRQLRQRVAAPIPPTLLRDAGDFNTVVEGKAVDLLKLPVPHWNRSDAGRYIGTWHVNVSKDPENGCRNVGVYRMQVLGSDKATLSTSSKSHLGMQFTKAEAQGKPLEVAVAIGVSEALLMAAAAGCHYGQDECDLAGALEGRSIQLIKCQHIDVEVPSDAEILIEGHLTPGVRVLDGPYFDYAGKSTTNPQAYLFEVTRMAFRKDPVFRGAVVGHPHAEDILLFSLLSEVGLFDFHGSRIRRAIQIACLKEGLFRSFQLAGRIGPGMLRVRPAQTVLPPEPQPTATGQINAGTELGGA